MERDYILAGNADCIKQWIGAVNCLKEAISEQFGARVEQIQTLLSLEDPAQISISFCVGVSRVALAEELERIFSFLSERFIRLRFASFKWKRGPLLDDSLEIKVEGYLTKPADSTGRQA